MKAVDIHHLNSRCFEVFRSAEQGLVMVTSQDRPEALLVSMSQLNDIPNLDQIRLVLGVSMFKEKQLSIGSAAKIAGKSLAEMLTLISDAGIPVVDYSEDEARDEADLVESFVHEFLES